MLLSLPALPTMLLLVDKPRRAPESRRDLPSTPSC
jgi:hypothetical protein